MAVHVQWDRHATMLSSRVHAQHVVFTLGILLGTCVLTHSEHTTLAYTAEGPVQGSLLMSGAVVQFTNIPYAAPPIRFQRARPPINRTGTFDATDSNVNKICWQNGVTVDWFAQHPVNETEDCLIANIVTPSVALPSSSAKFPLLPVLVMVHGGGFVAGSGALYNGTWMSVEQDVVVVTFNYRLGPLGFLVHSEVFGNTKSSNSQQYTVNQANTEDDVGNGGMNGILDMVQALRYVCLYDFVAIDWHCSS